MKKKTLKKILEELFLNEYLEKPLNIFLRIPLKIPRKIHSTINTKTPWRKCSKNSVDIIQKSTRESFVDSKKLAVQCLSELLKIFLKEFLDVFSQIT